MKTTVWALALLAASSFYTQAQGCDDKDEAQVITIPLVFESGFKALSDEDYQERFALNGKTLKLRLKGPVLLEASFVLGLDNQNRVPFRFSSPIPDGIYTLEPEFSLLSIHDKSRISEKHPHGYPCHFSTIVNVPQAQTFEVRGGELLSAQAIETSLTCE